jgi:hypothetical protein
MANNIDFIYAVNRLRINERWFVRDEQLKNIIAEFPQESKILNFEDTYTTNGMDNDLYQQGFLQVVTESVYHYPSAFISEKTSKPLLNKRPFVILGPTGSLKQLHNLGFKTFSAFWSEEYDTINDPEKRLLAVTDVIEYVCNHSIDELKSLCIKMESVLNYNFDYYVNEFKNNESKKFELACIENLKPRYV